jgi:hypothetical protein
MPVVSDDDRGRTTSTAGDVVGKSRVSRPKGKEASASMLERGKKNSASRKSHAPQARSAGIAASGVSTGEEFAQLMSALMSDVIEGSVSPEIANAACNAGGKLLKIVEMQYRYGVDQKQRPQSLVLANRARTA